MLSKNLSLIITRDLAKLKQELELYKKEENIWRVDKEIANSAGNLCLHLVGNLNAYIGNELGHSGYVRNRPDEFSLKDIPRSELVKRVEDTIKAVGDVLGSFPEADLEKNFPVVVFDKPVSTGYFLLHLSNHLGYHLGQVNYHRRLLDY